MRVDIQRISNYNEGYFIVSNENGDAMFCRLCDRLQWDELYDFLMKPLDIKIEEPENIDDNIARAEKANEKLNGTIAKADDADKKLNDTIKKAQEENARLEQNIAKAKDIPAKLKRNA